MQYLAIIRHGDFIERELKLNVNGKEQMRTLAPILAKLNPEIYSSLGPRSVESAKLLAFYLQKEVRLYISLVLRHVPWNIDCTHKPSTS